MSTPTASDHLEATQHAMLIRAGLLDSDNPACHPRASSIVSANGHILEELADFCAGLSKNARPAGSVVSLSGFHTLEFKNTLANVLRTAAQRQFDASSDHLSLCKVVNLPNFIPQKTVNGHISAELAEIPENSEVTEAIAYDGTTTQIAKLKTYGRNIYLSHMLLRNDDIGMIATSFRSWGGSAARLESRLVFDLITSNPTLGDSESLFDSGHGNVVSHADIFSETMLGQAMEKLRKLDPDGTDEAQNAEPSVLAVAANLEFTARKIVFESGLDLKVVASPRITDDTWFLLPDPEKTPAIGLLRLAGAKSPMRVENTRDRKNRDGMLVGVRTDTGVVPLSRFIIRGGA